MLTGDRRFQANVDPALGSPLTGAVPADRPMGRRSMNNLSSPTRARIVAGALQDFLRNEAAGGIVLLVATVVALVWANSGWSSTYGDFWHTRVRIGPSSWGLDEDLQHWVSDALMTVFFFLVGLEIKREATVGELNKLGTVTLPALAALGGMILPALIFTATVGGGAASAGWAIPMATDIAFVVGVLALLGNRVPGGLKLFLLTLAIIDDIGAIAVIALFYSGGVSVAWLVGATACIVAVGASRRFGLSSPLSYVPWGVALWYCTYRAGVHPTVAGVILGLLTPAVPIEGRHVLENLEHRLHPWSAFLIVPVFALANAGVDLRGIAITSLVSSRLTLGVVAGLIVGKTLGISLFALGGRRLGMGRLPRGVGAGHMVCGGALGGIGFTVALFITTLAFSDETLQAQAKTGILAGSIIAGAVGAATLAWLRDPSREDAQLPTPS